MKAHMKLVGFGTSNKVKNHCIRVTKTLNILADLTLPSVFSSKMGHLTLFHLSLTATKPSLAIDIYADPEVIVQNGTTGILRCTFKSSEVVGSATSVTWSFQSSHPDNQYSKAPYAVSAVSSFIYVNQCSNYFVVFNSYVCKNKCNIMVFNVNRQKEQDVFVTSYQLSDDFFVVIIGRSLDGFFLNSYNQVEIILHKK